MIISRSMRASVGIELSASGPAAPATGAARASLPVTSLESASRRQDGVRFGERDHAAQLVLQLADVAGPGREQQLLHGVFGDADLALAVFDRRPS